MLFVAQACKYAKDDERLAQCNPIALLQMSPTLFFWNLSVGLSLYFFWRWLGLIETDRKLTRSSITTTNTLTGIYFRICRSWTFVCWCFTVARLSASLDTTNVNNPGPTRTKDQAVKHPQKHCLHCGQNQNTDQHPFLDKKNIDFAKNIDYIRPNPSRLYLLENIAPSLFLLQAMPQHVQRQKIMKTTMIGMRMSILKEE